MPDTPRTTAALQTLFPDNTSGQITPQRARDLIVSYWNKLDTPGLLAIPSQGGNGGKFLTTDGSNLSWATAGGANNHAALTNLSYDTAGHTGFAGTGVVNAFTANQSITGTLTVTGNVSASGQVTAPLFTTADSSVTFQQTGAANPSKLVLGDSGGQFQNTATGVFNLSFVGAGPQALQLVMEGRSGSQLVAVPEFQLGPSGNPSFVTSAGGSLFRRNTTTFQSSAAGAKVVVVKAAASQSSSLLEFQNSSSTILSRFSSNGNLLFPAGGSVFLNNNTSYYIKDTGGVDQAVARIDAGDNYYWQSSSAGGAVYYGTTDGASNGTLYFQTRGLNRAVVTSTGQFAFNSSLTLDVNVVPTAIYGSEGQVANLTNWYDFDGNVLAFVTAAGVFSGSGAGLTGVAKLAAANAFTVSPQTITVNNAANKGLVITAAASQSATLLEINDSTNAYVLRVSASGFNFRPGTDSTGAFVITKAGTSTEIFRVDTSNQRLGIGLNGSAPSYPLHIKGGIEFGLGPTSNPAANSVSFVSQDASGSGFEFQTRLGGSVTPKMTIAGDGNVLVNGFGAGVVGLTVKGAGSQTANLQEWKNNANTLQGSFTALGQFYAGDTAPSRSDPGFYADRVNGDLVLQFTSNSQTVKLQLDGSSGYFGTGTVIPLSVIMNNSVIAQFTTGNDFGLSVTGGSVTARMHILTSAAKVGLAVQAAASQTANLQEWRDNTGAGLTAITANGAFSPVSLADASAANNTIYYSTTANKLVYKDSGGVVNNLY